MDGMNKWPAMPLGLLFTPCEENWVNIRSRMSGEWGGWSLNDQTEILRTRATSMDHPYNTDFRNIRRSYCW